MGEAKAALNDPWPNGLALYRPPAGRRVLVMAPHPDDEAVGCGAYLARLAARGAVVVVVFVTSGGAALDGRIDPVAASHRVAESRRALEFLGVRESYYWELPDGRLAMLAPPAARFAALVSRFDPDLIFVPHAGEAHPDHATVAGWPALLADDERDGRCVLTYEIWTPLAPAWVADATAHYACKLAAIRAYESQCRKYGLDRLALGLNRYRAAWARMRSWRFAEAFGRFGEEMA